MLTDVRRSAEAQPKNDGLKHALENAIAIKREGEVVASQADRS